MAGFTWGRTTTIATFLANVLLVISLVIFARGFFPHKAFLPGLATWEDASSEDLSGASAQASAAAAPRAAPFDKVVFMVVDALRTDFVYGDDSGFGFVQSLIKSGAAVPFTGHASAPTITMPRVKAITTGSVPSFLDLLLNFAESDTTSTLKDQDSWLAQLRRRRSSTNGKLLMYGDDTWLRLFPGFFDRADGTTSFFVSDFTEVDNNVTRHIPAELEADDWSAMILHFLGLDHIGHKTGPRGPNMPAKQREMDGIVSQIYTAFETHKHLESCLLVLLGDHGMNDAGNHGASSPGEVSTALTFISPKFKSAFEGQPGPLVSVADFKYYNVVQQSDIVPTLAALLGFPIPRNNLGVIIPRLLELWTVEEDQYHLLYENAEQISRIARATFASDLFDDDEQDLVWDDCSTKGDDVEILACLWKAISRDHKTHLQGGATKTSSRMARLQTFLHHSQTLLSGTASNYELASMKLGIGLSALALALCLPAFSTGLLRSGGADGVVLVCIMLTYAVTMFASSYVEEEHQFWYWILGGWLVVLFCKDGRYKTGTNSTLVSGQTGTALVFFLLGVVRRWRQTGQKYAGEPDLLSQVVTPDAWLLWTLVGLTYGALSRDLSRRAVAWTGSRQMGVLPVLVCGSGFLFKLAFTAADAPELLHRFSPLGPLVSFVAGYPLVGLARVVFLGLAHLLGCSIYYEAPWQGARHLQSFLAAFQDVLSLLLITQSRTVFVPLFLLFGLQLRLLRRGRNHGVVEIAILALLFQYAAFFAAGGTNSIATVDLSNAYNGVGGYNVAAVGALTFVSNWAGPIWWAFAVGQLFSSTQLTMGACSFLLTALMTFACIHALAVMVACMVLREHLFIWTVFSPKYLYTAAWIVGQHTVVNALGVGLLLWRH